ncbi:MULTISPECIES: hypothetical protein [Stenotrophomonas]|jgi:hypothetical protein|uniref:Uracil-DNA glycosylase-like domain-containing protein n=1 Tax=Stenotrophomonas rhizophila TaxID=216778 RepID=A0A7V7YJC7_9GAMM|nr:MULTISPECIES: hypothetical protein [Stenotrophomonas]KAB7632198.1 hypothetical protein F9K92_02945 [Stenotrophomonas rhizophila]
MIDPFALQEEAWPESVAFLPYVGKHYMAGPRGHRVLLLGESHYRCEGSTDDPAVTRGFTRGTFNDMATCQRKGGGKFFDELDRIVTCQELPPVEIAADAWRHVSFLNLSQAFAGSHAGHRPRNEQLRLGGDVLVKTVLPVLRPTVILVLGRTAWRQFRHGEVAQRIPLFRAARVNQGARKRRYVEEREVWRLKYEGGAAWMTWVYHPSWNVDHWEDRAGALRHLLELSVQA